MIGDRAYGTTPAKVATIAGAVAEGLMAGGVLPVLKHLPGHGRATADSHLALPVVEHRSRDAGVNRFRRVPAAGETSFGDDGACCV